MSQSITADEGQAAQIMIPSPDLDNVSHPTLTPRPDADLYPDVVTYLPDANCRWARRMVGGIVSR
jgi:hypothetical protein